MFRNGLDFVTQRHDFNLVDLFKTVFIIIFILKVFSVHSKLNYNPHRRIMICPDVCRNLTYYQYQIQITGSVCGCQLLQRSRKL